MNPADFTIEFYRKCLSQHNWKLETAEDHWNQQMLHHVGLTRKGDFWREFKTLAEQHKKHFPVASQEATETQNTKPNTTTMNTPPKEATETQNIKPNATATMNPLLKDMYENLIKPIVDVLQRIAVCLEALDPNACVKSNTAEPEDKPEPKKRGPKAKAAEITSETMEEVKKAVTNEKIELEAIQEEEPYLTGPELVELMKPLKDTPYTKKLVEFRDGTLGFSKMTREMSDPAMLRQMEAKILEFLAANEEDQKEV
jgi:hypothetical protein